MRHLTRLGTVGVLVAAALVPPLHPLAGAQTGPRLVGSLPAQPPSDVANPDRANGLLVANPSSRRLYQLRDLNQVSRSTKIEVIDLDSLRPLRTVTFPNATFPTAGPFVLLTTDGEGYAGVPHAVDERGRRLFFPYFRQTAGFTAGLFGVAVFDERTMTVTVQEAPRTFPASGLAQPLGAFWSEPEGRLYVLGRTVIQKNPDLESRAVQEGGVAALPTTVVVRWNPDKPPAQVAQDPLGYADAVRVVRACRRGLPNELTNGKFQMVVLSSRFEPSVWVGCSTANLGFQLVRLDRNQLPDPSGLEEVYPGPERIRSTLADPVSERIFARYTSGGETWWVFDTRRRAWVGRIGVPTLPKDLAAGVDPGTGRLYLHYEGVGLLRADARRQEVPQADIFPAVRRTGWGLPIVFDPPTGRFFLRAAPDRYDVYADEPPRPEPPPDDPDARTTDVEEQEGQTAASFSGVARSYGARALLLGGLWGVWPPDQFGTGRGLLISTGTGCGPREREVAVGLVEDTNLTSSQASARAHALRADDATRQDLGAPSRCDLAPNSPIQPLNNRYPGLASLPDPNPPPGQRSSAAGFLDREASRVTDPDTLFVAAECSGDEGRRAAAVRQPGEGRPFTEAPPPLAEALRGVRAHRLEAVVTCEESRSRAGGEAGGPALEVAPAAGLPGLRVAEASSQTRLFRDPRRGLVAQAYAVARGISVGETATGAPVVSIEAVESWAEAAANGRRKGRSRDDTAVARYVRRITGVTVRAADGAPVFTCQDCARDLLLAQQQMNQALAGRAEVRFPMPDPRLITGTPGGYQAAVQKDEFALRADTALNNDPSFQVPALEVVSTNDDPSLRARQIVQLAGVAAASSYGIFQLGGFAPPPGEPEGSPLPPGAEVLSTALGGTTVYESGTSGPAPALGTPSATAPLPARVARQAVRAATLVVRNPREGLLTAAVWLAFLVPLYAFVRRRKLVRSLASS